MSLEECKRIAKARRETARSRARILESDRRAEGMVDDGVVEIALYPFHIGFPPSNWIVGVASHKHWTVSKKPFYRREPAVKYFEELVREYDLKEAES